MIDIQLPTENDFPNSGSSYGNLKYALSLISQIPISDHATFEQIGILQTVMMLLLMHHDNGNFFSSVIKIFSAIFKLPHYSTGWWQAMKSKFQFIAELPAFIQAVELLYINSGSKPLSLEIIQDLLELESIELLKIHELIKSSLIFTKKTTSYSTTLLHAKLLRLAIQKADILSDRVVLLIENIKANHGSINYSP